MKNLRTVFSIVALFLITSVAAFAQLDSVSHITDILPYHLAISSGKTTNIIFPYAVLNANRGSQDILAQKVDGMSNILQVKAAKMDFEQTNLSVVTTDGKFYSFILDYDENPIILNIRFDEHANVSAVTPINSRAVDEAELKGISQAIAVSRPTMWVMDKKHGIRFSLNGLYIRNDVMYYQLTIKNSTNINYDIDQFRFYIRDEKKAKRTASQELELIPLYIFNNTPAVKNRSTNVFVFSLAKTTIPDQKYMAIELMEKDGGRNYKLKLNNKKLVKAKVIRH